MADDAAAARWRPFIIVASYVFYGWWDWRFVLLLAGSTLFNQLLARRIHARADAVPAQGAADRRARRQPRRARLLQVLRLLRHLERQPARRSSGSTCRSRCGRSCCRSGSPSSRSWRSATSSTSTAATSSRRRSRSSPSTSRSSRTSSPARSCGRPSSSRSSSTPRNPRRVDTSRAFYLIATGLFKKVVIANYLARDDRRRGLRRAGPALVARDPDRGLRATPSRSTRLLAATPTSRSASRCCSASSSRRTSTRPYAAASLQDFWRRWHMTLSRWLRDYLYIPLGGNRGRRAS